MMFSFVVSTSACVIICDVRGRPEGCSNESVYNPHFKLTHISIAIMSVSCGQF